MILDFSFIAKKLISTILNILFEKNILKLWLEKVKIFFYDILGCTLIKCKLYTLPDNKITKSSHCINDPNPWKYLHNRLHVT